MAWTRPTSHHTGRSRTCQCCRNSCRERLVGSSSASSWTTCSPPTCCQPTRADLDHASLQKLPFCGCCKTFSWLSTVEIWLPWSFWISQLHSTRLIMRFCFSVRATSYRPCTYDISDVAHRWFRSYLLGRSQYVRSGTSSSSVIDLICGVPQVKDQSLVRFCSYGRSVHRVPDFFDRKPWSDTAHNIGAYADDTQVYGSCPASNVDAFSVKLTACSCRSQLDAVEVTSA